MKKTTKTDFIIIGGGVAGLSAANALAEAGADVTLLEAGNYPAHKICGEFISPEALPLLEKWDITPAATIRHLKIALPNDTWSLKLPQIAATLPRYILDEALAKRAQRKGAQILTESSVEKIEPPKTDQEPFIVTLKSGEQWLAPILLLSTGRLKKQATPKFSTIGVKAHFEGLESPDELIMHLLPGAYFGVAPIGQNRVNVAGIISCTPEQAANPQATLQHFFEQQKASAFLSKLHTAHNLFDNWLTAPVPEFGIRTPSSHPNTFYIGDAAGVIPPATGNGLAMGLSSGLLAATYALKNDPKGYQAHWTQAYAPRISKGKLLHRLFLAPPYLTQTLPWLARTFPFLPKYLFEATRGR